MARLSLGPLVEPGGTHNQLSVWRQFDVHAMHSTRCRSFKVDTFAVVSAPVARALKLVFAGLPIGCAAQVSAAGVDDKHAVRRAVHPYAVLLLPFGIDAEGVVRSVTDLEHGGGFEERTWQEKTKKGDEPSAQKSGQAGPPPPLTRLVDFTWLGTHGGQPPRRCCFGRPHGGLPNIPVCFSATGSG